MTATKPDSNTNDGNGHPAPSAIIDLYVFKLDPAPADLERISQVLSPDEHARAQRLINPRAGNRFKAARATLRHVLGASTGIPPAQLTFAYATHAKPFLPDLEQTLHFNLSHSRDIGAIAVSYDFEVGIDVEVWRDVRDGLANRFFSNSEAAALAKLEGRERMAAFFRCWTRKEAVIKALGEGFSRPLDSFDVSITDVANPRVTRFEGDDPANWKLFSFSPGPQVSGAIALRSAKAPITLRHHPVKY